MYNIRTTVNLFQAGVKKASGIDMGSTKNKLKNFCWPLRVVLLFGMLKMYFFISLDYSKLRDIFFSNICNQVHIHYLISGTMRREGLGGFSPPLWGNVHACSTYTHSWLCNPHKNMPIEKFPRRSICSGPVPSFWRFCNRAFMVLNIKLYTCE